MIIISQDRKQKIQINKPSDLKIIGNRIVYNNIILGVYTEPHQKWAMEMLEEAYTKTGKKTEFKLPTEGKDYTLMREAFREYKEEYETSLEYKQNCKYNNSEGYDGQSEMRRNN